ncbi:MAG: ISAs1 family transposase, partial [Gammaproteobacteria bacterium]|nr:ISAs1 family transposase [Gammaproteobacteria bacterium]
MLFVAVCATLSGAAGWADIVEFAENRLDWLRCFIRLENGILVDDTFARVLSSLSPKALNDCFPSWLEDLRETNGGRLIAIDGKTLR